MQKDQDIKEIYSKWYDSLSNKNKKFMDSYNERSTTAAEFRRKKRLLGKTNYKNQKYIDINKPK